MSANFGGGGISSPTHIGVHIYYALHIINGEIGSAELSGNQPKITEPCA